MVSPRLPNSLTNEFDSGAYNDDASSGPTPWPELAIFFALVALSGYWSWCAISAVTQWVESL
jgi:hypothetical protein